MTAVPVALPIAAGVLFIIYLLYTRQFKWLVGVIRNAALGVAGMLALNTALAPFGVAVGVNALTAFIVGILGLPGLMMLYTARVML
jgi:inhibitor of the pro-sigma K processing machinery